MKTQRKIPIRITTEITAEMLLISIRSARVVIKEIKQKNNKQNSSSKVVTITQFCNHTGFTIDEIMLYCNGYKENID